MTLQSFPSEFPYMYMRKIFFSFLQYDLFLYSSSVIFHLGDDHSNLAVYSMLLLVGGGGGGVGNEGRGDKPQV